MAANLDVRFQSAIADHLPAGLVDPTHGLETSHAVASRLDDLRGPSRFAVAGTARARASKVRACRAWAPPPTSPATSAGSTPPAAGRSACARCAAMSCSSTSGPIPASTACARCPTSRRGTRATAATASSSSACTRPSSPSSAMPATWRPPSGARGSAIPWPRTTSSRRGTPGATSTGPPTTSIDARGQVRGAHFGEGDYDRTEMDIRALLREAGHADPGAMADPKGARSPDARGDARDLPGPGARRALRPAAAARHAHLRAGAQARDEPLRAVGHLGRERRRRDGRAPTPPSTPRSSARTPTSSSARHGAARATSRCCSTAARSPTIARAPTSTTAWCASTASASTTWSPRPPASTTRSRCASRPESRRTHSRSDSVAPMLATAPGSTFASATRPGPWSCASSCAAAGRRARSARG